MNITIFNGEMIDNLRLSSKIEKIEKILSDKHHVRVINLKDFKIKYCTGEFLCWTKTPGLCALKDDTNYLNEIYINSDFVLFTSSIKYGFITSLLKTTLDKLLPLLSVDFEYSNGVARHKQRYRNYPNVAFLFDFIAKDNQGDLVILEDLMMEASNSMFTKPVFVKSTDDFTAIEVCDEIINY